MRYYITALTIAMALSSSSVRADVGWDGTTYYRTTPIDPMAPLGHSAPAVVSAPIQQTTLPEPRKAVRPRVTSRRNPVTFYTGTYEYRDVRQGVNTSRR